MVWGTPNPYTLKQAISQCPKLYLASSLGNLEISLHIRDTEDTLDEASKKLSAEQQYFLSSFIPSDKNSNATPSIPVLMSTHTGSSSRNTSSYYVTHPTSVVDCEDEYQQDDVHTNSEDPLTSAMLNQAIIQGDRVKIQSRNSGNAERNIRQAYVQEEIETLQLFNATTAVEKDIMLGIVQSQEMEEIEELSANICLMARIQPANNTSDAGPSYDSAFISEVQSSSNTENEEQMYPTHTKIINSTVGDDQIDSNIILNH
ncbi:hypothetical protein Tco_1447599 [Tanacetum coccineum]